ncbi:MAG: putative molybdenum carrier protein [Gammaproteobacteria bacterium]|nr:putative molybdenum carrier protein [Gammaproteobacteria bacterium]
MRKLISGAQTGVDRAALDVALSLGIRCGGWVPCGRLAEDGVIPEKYPGLRECDSRDYAVRTRLNVIDADATLVLSRGALSGGTALTVELAQSLGKPFLHLDLDTMAFPEARDRLREWLSVNAPSVLNVAGPRASEDPSIHSASEAVLVAVLSGHCGPVSTGDQSPAG